MYKKPGIFQVWPNIISHFVTDWFTHQSLPYTTAVTLTTERKPSWLSRSICTWWWMFYCGQDSLWQDWIWIDFSGPQSPNHTWHHRCSSSRGKSFFFTKFRQDSHYLINHRFFRIFFIPTSYIPISRRLSKNLGTISKRYLIEVGHVKRRGSQAPLRSIPLSPRQMNLYRSTPYIYYLRYTFFVKSQHS